MQNAIDIFLLYVDKTAFNFENGDIELKLINNRDNYFNSLDIVKIITSNLKSSKTISIDFFNNICKDNGYDIKKVEVIIKDLYKKKIIYKVPHCYALYEEDKLDNLEKEFNKLKKYVYD